VWPFVDGGISIAIDRDQIRFAATDIDSAR
jgi:hypothetical protein